MARIDINEDFIRKAFKPVDIVNQKFPIKKRGYDTEAVDLFLKDVATSYEEIRNENIRLRGLFEQQKQEEEASVVRFEEKVEREASTDFLKQEKPKNEATRQGLMALLKEAIERIESKDSLESEVAILREEKRELERQIAEHKEMLRQITAQEDYMRSELQAMVEAAQQIIAKDVSHDRL